MTNQEILEKAVQKALDRSLPYALITLSGKRLKDTSELNMWLDTGDISIEELIFNHAFAKALWNTANTTKVVYDIKIDNGRRMSKPIWLEDWQYHLQMMVIADDPIKYLGENI